MRNLFLLILGTALFLVVVGYLTGSAQKGQTTNLQKLVNQSESKKTVKIAGVTVPVEIADTNQKRQQGLSGKESLNADSGMLFIFPDRLSPAFWMKNMNFAIDIIWIDGNKIVGIEKNAKPEPNVEDTKLRRYYSPSSFNYVLEVNSGFSDKNGFKIGDSVELPTI